MASTARPLPLHYPGARGGAGTQMRMIWQFSPEMVAALQKMENPRLVVPATLREIISWMRGQRPYAGASAGNNYIRRHFQHGNAATYKWRHLSRPYIQLRSPKPMLVKTGALMRRALAFRAKINPRTVTIDVTGRRYARIMQEGGIFQVPKAAPYILPKNRKVLRWFTPDLRPVFSRRAKAHDITIPPRDFLAPGKGDEAWMAKATEEALAAVIFGSRITTASST